MSGVRWEGYDVILDGDMVRFGSGEHDWVRPYPYPESEEHQELETASVTRDGRMLNISSENYLFTFYAVEDWRDHDGDVKGQVFQYRWRRRRFPLSLFRLPDVPSPLQGIHPD